MVYYMTYESTLIFQAHKQGMTKKKFYPRFGQNHQMVALAAASLILMEIFAVYFPEYVDSENIKRI